MSNYVYDTRFFDGFHNFSDYVITFKEAHTVNETIESMCQFYSNADYAASIRIYAKNMTYDQNPLCVVDINKGKISSVINKLPHNVFSSRVIKGYATADTITQHNNYYFYIDKEEDEL